MLDEYSRQYLDRISVDVAVTRTKVEAIERNLDVIHTQACRQEIRLGRVERKVYALWVVGPLLVGVTGFLHFFRNWFTEQ